MDAIKDFIGSRFITTINQSKYRYDEILKQRTKRDMATYLHWNAWKVWVHCVDEALCLGDGVAVLPVLAVKLGIARRLVGT